MLKIGQVYEHRTNFKGYTITIIDLAEDLEFAQFKCSYCEKIHELPTMDLEMLIKERELCQLI